jgi:hypothetical protein
MADGYTYTYTTTGNGVNINLQTVLGIKETRRSWTVTVYNTTAGTANGTILIGRNNNTGIPLVSGASINFDMVKAPDITFNDQKVAGIQIGVDDSGPIDKGDLIVTTYPGD